MHTDPADDRDRGASQAPDMELLSLTSPARNARLLDESNQLGDAILTKLRYRLAEQGDELRSNQIRSFKRLIQFVENGKFKGLIKQPPAAGKTRLFAEIIAAIEKPSMVLVPRANLRGRSHETLLEVGISPERVFEIAPAANSTALMQVHALLEKVGPPKDAFWTFIMTYRSLLSIYNNSSEVFSELMDSVKVIVSDEAHESLGSKTRSMLIQGDRGFDDNLLEVSADFLSRRENLQLLRSKMDQFIGKHGVRDPAELLKPVSNMFAASLTAYLNHDQGSHALQRIHVSPDLEKMCASALTFAGQKGRESEAYEAMQAQRFIVGLRNFAGVTLEQSIDQVIDASSHPHLHLRLTATPQLGIKRVEKEYGLEVIDWVRIQDLINEGYLVFPTHISVGEATYRAENEEINVNNTFLRELCGEERFIMEDGRSVIEAVTERYLEEREKHDGYLPATAFCETVEQAEKLRKYFEQLGLKAVRCTSASGEIAAGTPPDQAQELLEKPPGDPERIDVVTTVRQVGIGWDVRTLRAALWYTITHSPAKSLQSNGRIMRSLIEGDLWPAKTSDNTVIIEPGWKVTGQKFSSVTDISGSPHEPSPSEVDDAFPSEEELYVAQNSLEMMVALGEIDASLALKRGVPLRRVRFDVHSEDQLRLLIGGIDDLIEDGLPVDLRRSKFRHEGMRWNVTGQRLMKRLFPDSADGRNAASALAKLLWPEEAKEKLFDAGNDEHLRALIGSPAQLMRGTAPMGSLYRCEFTNPERDWHVSGPELGVLLFGTEETSAKHVDELLERLWPVTVKDQGLNYKRPGQLQALVGSVSDIRALEDVYAHEFTSDDFGWRVSGRVILSKLAGDQPLMRVDPREFLIEKAYGSQELVKAADPPLVTNVPEPTSEIPNPEAESGEANTEPVFTERPERNYVGLLHELLQQLHYSGSPVFKVVDQHGPDHCKAFTVSCEVAKKVGMATGHSKKIANQYAAKACYEQLKGTLPAEMNQSTASPGVGSVAASAVSTVRDPIHTSRPREGNCVSLLNQRCQKAPEIKARPQYQTIVHHDGKFVEVKCQVGGWTTEAKGSNGKIAKQHAAQAMLDQHLPVDPAGSELSSVKESVSSAISMVGFGDTYLQLAQQNPMSALSNFSKKFFGEVPKWEHSTPTDEENVAIRWRAYLLSEEHGLQEVIATGERKGKSRIVKNRAARELLRKLIAVISAQREDEAKEE